MRIAHTRLIGEGQGPCSTIAKKCEELGMGMFLAVGKGSEQEPRFIHMTYKPAKKPKKRLCNGSAELR